jgi:hypothetical protein
MKYILRHFDLNLYYFHLLQFVHYTLLGMFLKSILSLAFMCNQTLMTYIIEFITIAESHICYLNQTLGPSFITSANLPLVNSAPHVGLFGFLVLWCQTLKGLRGPASRCHAEGFKMSPWLKALGAVILYEALGMDSLQLHRGSKQANQIYP